MKSEIRTDPSIRCLYDELVPIDKIKTHPKNPNKHSSKQIDRFAEILRYQGTRRPLRVSKTTGLLTVGHGQLEAYRANGWTHAPVNFQEYDSEEQEYADIVADNSISSWAVLDLSEINSEIENFSPDFNLDMLGIDGFKLDPAELMYGPKRGRNEMTKDEKSRDYMDSQVRNIVLVYSLEEYTRVAQLLDTVMAEKNLSSFSETVLFLLEEHARSKAQEA